MANIILFLFIVLIAFSGLFYFQQPGMIFFPVSEISETPGDWGFEYEDVYIKTADNKKLHGWLVPNPGSKYTLLFFHGNAGNISHRGESVKIFHQLGLSVFIFDYRGYGESEGKPGEQGLYRDADAVWQFLTDVKKIRQDNIIIYGRSLGGAIAIKLASKVQAHKLIVESTFSSGRDMARSIFPVLSHFIYLRYDFYNEKNIRDVSFPVMVIHSPDDEIIPFQQGKAVFEAANEPKTFYTLTGDHNSGFFMSQPGYEQAISRFISE